MKLFNEGKLLRFLGYAVGEIALIIVGIMLARMETDFFFTRDIGIIPEFGDATILRHIENQT